MDLAHDRLGSGEPLVLLHGLGSERRAFEPVVDRLATEREVLSVDLPGLGESAPLPAGVPATPAELARAVAAFLDGAGLPAVHLAGNSLGGWVSLELAKLGRARSVTAVSPAGFWSPRELAWCRAQVGASRRLVRGLRPLLPALAATPAGRFAGLVYFGRPWRLPPAAMVRACRALADAPGFERAFRDAIAGRFSGGDRVRVPVTIVWGERDALLPVRQAARARRALPHARVVRLAGCGHVPFWDEPETLARALLEGSAAAGGAFAA